MSFDLNMLIGGVALFFSGMILYKLMDIIFPILVNFVLDKFNIENKILGLVRKIDDKYLDKLAKKAPKSAKIIEDKLVSLLVKIKAIIEDKG